MAAGFTAKEAHKMGLLICIYNLEYINWCESRAFCHIPVLNQLPWNIFANLNRDLIFRMMHSLPYFEIL